MHRQDHTEPRCVIRFFPDGEIDEDGLDEQETTGIQTMDYKVQLQNVAS